MMLLHVYMHCLKVESWVNDRKKKLTVGWPEVTVIEYPKNSPKNDVWKLNIKHPQ